MGSAGYTKHRKSSSFSSIFSIFASCCSNGGDDMSEDGFYGGRRIWRSDEDGRRWTAEPGIDRKASAFIDRFRTRVSDPERQALSV